MNKRWLHRLLHRKFDVVTVGFTESPVTTMGGYNVSPDIILDDVHPDEASIFIIPGGDMWEQGLHEDIINLLHQLHAKSINIAAICGATLEIARAVLMSAHSHTSYSKGYLKAITPDYRDDEFYVEKLAVTDKNLITKTS